jgi:hypothetical protein
MTLVLILIAIGTNAAHAAVGDMTIVGGMDFGFKQLRLDTGDGRNTFSPFYVTINPSIVLGYKSFYASLSYDKSISSDPETGQGTGPVTGNPTATTLDFAREDSTFTLGYRLNQSFNVFAGYTKGANEFTDIRADVVLIVTDIEYTTTGPFAGVAYGKSFGKKGTLGLSIGYAELDGELRFTGRPSAGGSTDVDGDVTGLSYGVTWSGPLSESLGYRAGVKATRYKMEDPGDITERYTNIFFGIVNYF